MKTLSAFIAHWHTRAYLPVTVGLVFTALSVAVALLGLPSTLSATLIAACSLGLWIILLMVHGGLVEAQRRASFSSREIDEFLEHLKHGVVSYDPNFTVRRLNPAAEQLLGVRAAEVVDTVIEPSAARNPHLARLARVLFPSLAPAAIELSDAGAWPQVVSIVLEEPHAEYTTTLHRITDPLGNVVEFLKLIEDKTREQEILRSKTEFITVAAHQLRTPLTAMGWLIDNIASGTPPSPELNEGLRGLRELSDRTLKITNDLLDAAKIEEGKFGYSFEDADLIGIVKTIVHEASSAAKQYKIGVFFSPPSRDTFIIRMDPSRIGTVLANFLDNAIKYNIENGRVTVSVEDLSAQSIARVVIEDTGIGIPQEDVGKLFAKLYRGSNAAVAQPNGSGLGLYIAKNIIRRHGGDVGIESTMGRGTTVWFTLPTDPSKIPAREANLDVA